MTEIYWITRLDAIYGCLLSIAILATVLFIASVIGWMCSACIVEEYEAKRDTRNSSLYDEEIKESKGYMSIFIKALKVFAIFVVFSYVGIIFTPTTKEAYIIYGVGGTIDYIKSNDKAKQLPDKCIDALTRYVDSIEKDNKKTDNNKQKTL